VYTGLRWEKGSFNIGTQGSASTEHLFMSVLKRGNMENNKNIQQKQLSHFVLYVTMSIVYLSTWLAEYIAEIGAPSITH
jgi:hypothetical protein